MMKSTEEILEAIDYRLAEYDKRVSDLTAQLKITDALRYMELIQENQGLRDFIVGEKDE